MSGGINFGVGREPIYQNVQTRRLPPPIPQEIPSSIPEVTTSLQRTIPIWKVTDCEKARTISTTNCEVVYHGQSNTWSCCTEKHCSCNRSTPNLTYTKTGRNGPGTPASTDSEISDCSLEERASSSVYNNVLPPLRSILNHSRVPDQPRIVLTSTEGDEVETPPLIPSRGRVVLSPAQTILFNQVPPPSLKSRGFSFSGCENVPSFTPTDQTRHSPSIQPHLADSVPPLPHKMSKVPEGYVPPKPHLNLLFPLNENGYLQMNKEQSVDRKDSKPPFEDLWNQDNQEVNADDPEYFSMSELYADEPLYQVYHKEAIVRDVLEQTMEDEDYEVEYEDYSTILTSMLKKTSEKRIGEMIQLDLVATVESLLPTSPGLRRYWSDTVQVKRSGLLDILSSQEKKHQECIFEIITSEASYLKSLKLLETHFMESYVLQPPTSTILSLNDYKHLFSNVKNIIEVSNRMLQELELVWKENVLLDAGKICRTLKTVAEKGYGVYVPYLTNAMFQERKLAELNAKPEFRSTLTDLEEAPEVNGLKLQSFLILPLQRITRIPLLIDAVLRGINLGDPVVSDFNECITVFQKILTKCNEEARQIENLEQLNELSHLLLFKEVKTIPIVSKTRHLIKKGPLVHIKRTEKLPVLMTMRFLKTLQWKVQKDRSTKHFFLFNDLLLITKKKNNQYEVIKSVKKCDIIVLTIDESNVEKYLPGGIPHGCNFLFSLEFFDEDTKMVLSCDSENERMRWVEACNPLLQNEQDDAVYEIHDCPQVQTIQRFIPSEPDELALEESDIVDVLRKTRDGWYEGQRIRDGRRGWFIASNTIEIENAHKRAKNRRQQWRLLKQSQPFQDQRLT